MCGTCVRQGEIAEWLDDLINEHLLRWDDAYTNAHITLDDGNVENGYIEQCLSYAPEAGDESWRPFLRWMLTVPEEERVPRLSLSWTGEAVE